jgi:hypothetical protein
MKDDSSYWSTSDDGYKLVVAHIFQNGSGLSSGITSLWKNEPTGHNRLVSQTEERQLCDPHRSSCNIVTLQNSFTLSYSL